MTTQTFKTIRTTRTQVEAGLLITMLQHADLHPLELGISAHYSLAGADIDYSVQVPTSEVTEAQELLDAYGIEET